MTAPLIVERAVRVLLVEDNPADAELVKELLSQEWPACELRCVDGRAAFLSELQHRDYDVILSDFGLQSLSGFEALELAKAHAPEIPFLFLSGTIGEDRAIEAVRRGAEDYVLKDRMKRLVTAVARAVRESEARRQQRKAENRVREQAEMLNQAREAIFITDLVNIVIYWNAGAERLYGWRAEEVVGKTAEQLFDPSTHAVVQAARAETLEKGQWAGELRMHNREREPLIVESRQTLIRDETGKPKARLCINADITDRKRLEEQSSVLFQSTCM